MRKISHRARTVKFKSYIFWKAATATATSKCRTRWNTFFSLRFKFLLLYKCASPFSLFQFQLWFLCCYLRGRNENKKKKKGGERKENGIVPSLVSLSIFQFLYGMCFCYGCALFDTTLYRAAAATATYCFERLDSFTDFLLHNCLSALIHTQCCSQCCCLFLLCLHHFPLLFIFLGLLLFTMLA